VKLILCTLCLNEMEWLPKLYEQHKDWPHLYRWIFVESADEVYARTNPHLASSEGLSVDGTSDFLRDLAAKDDRIEYIPFGFCRHEDPALCKVRARHAYLSAAEKHEPDFLLVLDADEFYTKKGQEKINWTFMHTGPNKHLYAFQFTHIWHPASVANEPLFKYEIKGGFWGIRHLKGIRWTPGLHYDDNHQRPTGFNGWGKLNFYDEPYCLHMAFASEPNHRTAKHRYYAERGESKDRKRSWYVKSRRCFETWKPGDRLPRGAQVVPYTGEIPEVFR